MERLATLGPDARDVHDGFRAVDEPSPYLAFWGHDTNEVVTLSQLPNKYLIPLSKPQPGRKIRHAPLLWSRAGSLLICERLRLNTAHVISVRLPDEVLSNTWWPVTIEEAQHKDETEKIMALWLNSTLGLMSIMAARVETEGAWIKMKKPLLEKLEVLSPLD